MEPFKNNQDGFDRHHSHQHGFILPVRGGGRTLQRRSQSLFGDDRSQMSTVEILQQALDIVSGATHLVDHQTSSRLTVPRPSSGQGPSHDGEGTSVVSPRRRRHHYLHPPPPQRIRHHPHRSNDRPSPSSTNNVLVDGPRSISPPPFRSQASLPDFGAVDAAAVAAVQPHPHSHHTVPDHEEDLDNLHDSVSSLVVEDNLDEDEGDESPKRDVVHRV